MTINQSMLNFTIDKLCAMLPHNPSANVWFLVLQDSMLYYEITTVNRVAAFVAQTAHESIEFTALEENLNYSTAGLLRIFPSYFDPALAAQCERRPQVIANIVYANRMGNGDADSGDGWTFRGRGLIQLTGRNNYEAASQAICDDDSLVKQPDAVSSQLEVSVEVACWFWYSNGLNELADADDIDSITKRITGGYTGKVERAANYQRNKIILLS